ncbi:MAG TPA: hypothetical protein VGP61_13740, partial [Gemmatimonadales bacterium]|nr:hypothetical protein [Gemmatimonadales bacterium]
AFTAFGRALSIDSTFALAGMAQELAANWSLTNFGTSQGLEIAFRHRDHLGPRDLILLHIWLPRQFEGRRLTGREIVEVRERLVEQIADRPEAWYLLGDQYFHAGPALGFSWEESSARAENAFRHALALDPNIQYLWMHLADLAWDRGNRGRYVHVLDSLGPKLPNVDLLRAMATGDSAAVRRLGKRLDTLPTAELLMVASYEAYELGAVELSDSTMARAIARPGDLSQRRNVLRAARSMYWGQGRPTDAARMDLRLRELETEPPTFVNSEAILAAMFADGDSLSASRAVQSLARNFDWHTARDTLPVNSHLLPALYLGLWAAWRGDTITSNAAVRYFDALGHMRDTTGDVTIPNWFADGLRVAASLRSPRRDVVERLDGILEQGPVYNAEARAMSNVLAARAWEQLGDRPRAAQAATRAATREVLWVMPLPALREQGRMLLALGDTAGAVRAWRQYLLARAAEPPQRKADDKIRAKLAELEHAEH